MNRFWEIDFLRGIAIIMMVLFHFLWDLNYFSIISVSLYSGFWGLFQKATASLFLLLVGVVLAINYYRKGSNYATDFFSRGVKVFAMGLVISAFTFVFVPDAFIYFGILHLIGFSILLSIPFVKRPQLSLAVAAIFILLPLLFNLRSIDFSSLVWAGLSNPSPTLDFFPLFPWLGVVLVGIWAGHKLYSGGMPKINLNEPDSNIVKALEALGRKSLLIYFAHQFILFPLAYLISLL